MASQTSRARLLGRLLAPAFGLALIVGACSSGATASPSTAAASAPASSAASSGAAGGLTLATATSTAGTTYLTGDNGMALYTYTKDTAPDASTCVDQCATNWPPLIAAGAAPTAGSGVSGKIATFKRPDGGTQVSYNGKPLYYFAADKKAGDTTGDKKGGVWFLATP
jgi:predicted lipoprotein with Yx(FWY)xxD motif